MTTQTLDRARTEQSVDAFFERVVADFRHRLALLDDDGDRRAIEDAVALLTDYRLSGMDEASFERLIATMREGRSPVAMSVLKPQAIASELSRLWTDYREENAAYG